MFIGLSLGLRGQLGGSAPLPTDVDVFGSVMLPFENGRTTDTAKNGQFLVNNFRTQASGTSNANDYWRGAYSCVAFCDPHRERIDAQNFLPHVFGTNSSSTTNRTTGLRYYPLAHATAAKRQRFEFWVRGETTPGTWLMESAVIPTSAKGPFVVWAWNDTTNGYLHVYDIDSGTWYDGAAVARPASWLGVSTVALTSNLVIGGIGSATFPADNSASFQNAAQWRGSIGDLLFCNHQLSKANIESMVTGSNPNTVATSAGATVRCHLPIATAGALDLTATTTFTGITLTQQGAVWPGETMRRQDATNWITLRAYNQPEHFPVEYGSTSARIRLRGNVGGLTGNLRWRVVRDNGDAITNWANSGITVTAGAFDGHVTAPEWTGKAQIQVCMSSDETIIASTHAYCTAGPVIEVHAQSEGVFASTQGRVAAANVASTTVTTLPENAETISFAFFDTSLNKFIGATLDQVVYLGEGCGAIIHRLRQYSQRSVHVRLNCVSGTSPLALMNDADTTRNWTDLVALRDLTTSKGASGEAVVSGHIIYGWEADLSVTNPMQVAYRPLLTGVGASSGVYDRTNNIPTADIDHYLFNSESSASAIVGFNPNNRATTGSGATATDASTEADQRDHFRNYSHLYNYFVGPEMTAHKMQGENAAGGLPAGAVTHPEPGDWEGSVETAISLADSIVKVIAPSSAYPGPVFFETISAGTAANKVIVELGLPRPNPGDGLSEGATGYSTATQSGSYTYALHTKEGGDPGAGFEASIDGGAWSKANVTSGVVTTGPNGRPAVELTLASTPATSVSIRYLPGSTGRYSSATITQENWRAGVLYFTGTAISGAPNEISDLLNLGWQVAGSNQALTL